MDILDYSSHNLKAVLVTENSILYLGLRSFEADSITSSSKELHRNHRFNYIKVSLQ